MKKKWLLLAAALLLAVPGCREQEEQVSGEKEENSPPLQEEYQVEISKNLADFQFAIDGDVWNLPSLMQEWLAGGWQYPEDKGERKLETESYIEGETLERENTSIQVDVANLEGEEKPVKDCYIGGVTLKYQKNGAVCQLPGGITLGKSVLNQVTEAYGTPTDEYSEKEDIYITYEFGIYKRAEFVFDTEQETLYQATLKNYREPVSGEEEISKEEPAEVSAYKAPGELTEDPADYIVSYDGQMYEIPAPVSEFVKNEWNIQEEGSDSYVKPGRHGYVTLEKGETVLYAVVKNYSEKTVPVEHAFVTKVSGDFDVVKVPITIGKGITLGMPEEEMKSRLGGILYETQEEEQGISYYLYSDETKKNFIRIFVDKDLQLIREIEISNSPESLSAQQKESEGTQESVPLGEGL